jgi:hypothetical protein
MTEYKVKVTELDTRWYNLEGKLHKEDGPAVENANGYEAYYINDKGLTEQEFNDRNKPRINKVVEIDGVKYKLVQI